MEQGDERGSLRSRLRYGAAGSVNCEKSTGMVKAHHYTMPVVFIVNICSGRSQEPFVLCGCGDLIVDGEQESESRLQSAITPFAR